MLVIDHKIFNIEISNVQSSPKNLCQILLCSKTHTLEVFFFSNYDLNLISSYSLSPVEAVG